MSDRVAVEHKVADVEAVGSQSDVEAVRSGAHGVAGHEVHVQKGTNAEIEYNGLTIKRNSNTFELAGYQVTLNKKYTEETPITLKATTDVDHFINKVEEFVNKYNEFITSTNGAINETKNRKYAPLTEEQKKDMSKDEIEKWEKTAKSGVIRRDSTVASGLQNLRSIIYSKCNQSDA